MGRHDFRSGFRDEVGSPGEGIGIDFCHSECDLGEGGSIGRLFLVVGLENGGQERCLDVRAKELSGVGRGGRGHSEVLSGKGSGLTKGDRKAHRGVDGGVVGAVEKCADSI